MNPQGFTFLTKFEPLCNRKSLFRDCNAYIKRFLLSVGPKRDLAHWGSSLCFFFETIQKQFDQKETNDRANTNEQDIGGG